jgi:hypothetical protein
MSYSVDRFRGSATYTVEDGTIDSSLDIKLIGKNYAGYGEIQNENFLHLLENFSGADAPARPLSGQIWFDSSNSKLKFYDGVKFRTTGGAEVGPNAPSGLTTGDFWWDDTNKQLYSWDGAAFVLIGPLGVSGAGTTQFRSRNVLDTLGNSHAIIESIVDGTTVFIISADEFTLNVSNAITGYSLIKKGTTLIYSSSGTTSTDHVYWGTASNSLKLNGLSSSDFVLAAASNYSGLVSFADVGFRVGNDNDLRVFVAGGDTPTIQNQVGNTIAFQTTSASVTVTPLRLVAEDVLPGVDNTSDIGSTTFKFATVYANSFNGPATQSDSLNVGGTYRTAAVAATANTVAIRDASGNLAANIFNGTATSAQYADLAEKYLPDAEYSVGTVVSVGGSKEITASSTGDQAIGVISENPAFMMNKDLEGGVYVALKGRVPVKVAGTVIKGQRLVAANDGTAVISSAHNSNVFAIALETNADAGIKLVECVIL